MIPAYIHVFHKPNSLSFLIHGQIALWWRHGMETAPASLALCEGIHQWPADSPHKGLVMLSFSVCFFFVPGTKSLLNTTQFLVIWEVFMLMWRHCNDMNRSPSAKSIDFFVFALYTYIHARVCVLIYIDFKYLYHQNLRKPCVLIWPTNSSMDQRIDW